MNKHKAQVHTVHRENILPADTCHSVIAINKLQEIMGDTHIISPVSDWCVGLCVQSVLNRQAMETVGSQTSCSG